MVLYRDEAIVLRTHKLSDADVLEAVAGAGEGAPEDRRLRDVLLALISLGYKPREVQKLIGELDVDGKSAEDIIRLALRQVAL